MEIKFGMVSVIIIEKTTNRRRLGLATSKYSGQHLNNPRYELKQLLILLRQINDIPLSEMAKKLEITTAKLLEYERLPKVSDEYEAIYIEVLKEYVLLASKDKISFEDALKIYMNQKGLHKYNNAYKLALFGQIMYDDFYVNMNALKENGAVTNLPVSKDSSKYMVWSTERYNTAFFMLGMLREMLGVESKFISTYIGITREMLKEFETGVKNYKQSIELYYLYNQFCECLSKELRLRGINKNVEEIITAMIQNGYSRAMDSLKLRHILLVEIYK